MSPEDSLELEETKLANGLYRVVDSEEGYVVYYSVFDGQVTSIDAEPLRD